MKWLKDGSITSPRNFQGNGVCAGIKNLNNKDLALVVSSKPAQAAGMITKNRIKAASCLVTAEHLANGEAQAFFINSGNANCGTGLGVKESVAKTELLLGQVAEKLELEPENILYGSTGVIGVELPFDRIEGALDRLVEGLSLEGGHAAAEAIMTTDTRIKQTALSFNLHGKDITIGAMAKGSGMVHPNMATMLVFLTTDLAIDKLLLKEALNSAVGESFHRLTIDGDTSTNDMVLILANGMALNPMITGRNRDYELFVSCLTEVCQQLAKEIIRDAEGATKFITVEVVGAPDRVVADKLARSVACSSLVKTAFFGEDANWGRVLMALGNAGVDFSLEKLQIFYGPHLVFEKGAACSPFPEAEVSQLLAQPEVTLRIALGAGGASNWIWTCDLSYDYVKINADYRS